jgi:hypothetical protein
VNTQQTEEQNPKTAPCVPVEERKLMKKNPKKTIVLPWLFYKKQKKRKNNL